MKRCLKRGAPGMEKVVAIADRTKRGTLGAPVLSVRTIATALCVSSAAVAQQVPSLSGELRSLRVYNRYLRTCEAIANSHAGL